MRTFLGLNAFQWEHKRRWDLAGNSSEFCRAEAALAVPGLTDFSVFVRRESQTASTFELVLWTAPIYFRPLDESFDANPAALLLPLTLTPATGLQMGGTAAQVFGAKVGSEQPMGSLLFWQMKNTTGDGAQLVADIYLVANHRGVVSLPRFVRALDATDASQGSANLAQGRR